MGDDEGNGVGHGPFHWIGFDYLCAAENGNGGSFCFPAGDGFGDQTGNGSNTELDGVGAGG